MDEVEDALASSIEAKNLVCSQTNFVNILEMLIQKIPEPIQSTTLQELTIDGLPNDLIFSDDSLIERFGRSAQTVRSLSIGNLRCTRPETRRSIALLVAIILSGKSTPSRLRLWNLGFEAKYGYIILNTLLLKEFGGLEELTMYLNDEFWTPESGCLELLKQLLPLQRQMKKLFLHFEGFPYEALRSDKNLPDAVLEQLQPVIVLEYGKEHQLPMTKIRQEMLR